MVCVFKVSFAIATLLFFLLFCSSYARFEIPAPCWSSWSQAMASRGERSQLSYSNDPWFSLSGVVSKNEIAQHLIHSKPPKKSILLVHVGKTCGTSVAKALYNNQIMFTQVHVHPVDHEMVHQFDYILITIRDPFNRTVSVYNFANPLWSNITHAPQLSTHYEFYNCFPTISDYGEQLFDNSSCGNISRNSGIMHFKMNTCGYLSGVVDLLLQFPQKVFLIQTETCEADLTRILDTIGFKNLDVLDSFPREWSYRPPHETVVSTKAQKNIRQQLEDAGEYPLYRYLIETFT
jgi:hypothetical protein